MPTVADLLARGSKLANQLNNMVRRLAVAGASASSVGKWILAGKIGAYGEEEVMKADLFSGVGVAWRPKDRSKVEVIVVNAGGASRQSAIIAARDIATAITDLAADETVIFNSVAMLRLKPDGTVQVTNRSGGVAVQLATKADVDALAAYVDKQFDPATGHTHKAVIPAQPTNIVEGTAGAGVTTVPTAAGTSVLKGQ